MKSRIRISSGNGINVVSLSVVLFLICFVSVTLSFLHFLLSNLISFIFVRFTFWSIFNRIKLLFKPSEHYMRFSADRLIHILNSTLELWNCMCWLCCSICSIILGLQILSKCNISESNQTRMFLRKITLLSNCS